MNSRIDINAWAVFDAVAASGSFTGAARKLGVSVPTVSKTIAALEARLGMALFHRTSRRLSLSSAGEAARQRAASLVGGFMELEEDLRDADGPPRGLIRLSAPLSFSILHLSGVLTKFLSDWPEIEIDLHATDRRIDMIAEGMDLTLRIGKLDDSSLRARRLCAIRIPVAASPAYLERYGTPTRPEDLEHHHAIAYSQAAEPTRWRFLHDLEGERAVDVSPRLLVDNGDIGLDALRAGVGIACQPEFFLWNDLRDGTLVELLRPWYIAPVGAFILTPPSRLQPRRVRLLIDALVEAFRRVPWAL